MFFEKFLKNLTPFYCKNVGELFADKQLFDT
jgi:hypothetical protein